MKFFTSKKNILLTIALLLAVGFFSIKTATLVFAAPNPQINYQGKLTASTSAAVSDGAYNMVFKLYTAPTGGSPIWTENDTSTHHVQVQNGLFSIMLGSTTSLTGVNFNQPLYLGVTIGSDSEMTPRKALGTVPAAFIANHAINASSSDNAKTVGGVASSSFLRSDQADTASGLLTFTGGFISNGSSTITNVTAINATTTYLSINGERFSDLTGTGLQNTGGALGLNTTYLDTRYASTSEFDTCSELSAILAGDTTGSCGSFVLSASPTFTGTTTFSGGNLLIDNDGVVVANSRGYDYSFFVGEGAGYGSGSIVFSNSNFIGHNAGYEAVDADHSNFFGSSAGYGAAGASYSNFLGAGAGYEATNSANSNFIGISAGDHAANSGSSNFIGNDTGASATGAYNSNFMGNGAGYEAVGASNSNFIGTNAGYGAVDTHHSDFIGQYAGENASSTSYSSFIGNGSGEGAVSVTVSNFFGQYAGESTNNVQYSSFLGNSAGEGATGTLSSDFLGQYAGETSHNVQYSSFLGNGAGESALNILSSSFVGQYAGQASGISYSDFTGYSAGEGARATQYSSFIGPFAGSGASSTAYSNFLGYGAGESTLKANNSIFIGSNAGRDDTVNNSLSVASTSIAIGQWSGTGGFSDSIAIGHSVTNSATRQLNIGNVLYATGIYAPSSDISYPTLQSATPLSGGKFGIGTSTPSQTLTVAGSARITGALYGSNNSAGSNGYVLQSSATGFRWVATSTLGLGASGATVSSVGLSAPTGFTVSGSPVTSAGTLALSYSAGYQGLLTASSTAWQSFYTTPSSRITAGTGLSWSGNTLNCATASGATQGCLSTADWTSFNGRISSTSLNTSAKLAALITDETGSGALVFGTAPTLSSTTISGILKLSSQTASRGLFIDAKNRATTTALSAYLANSLSDETGSGSVVFSASPTFTGTTTNAGATFSGKVGIGTTTPVQSLSVVGGINSYGNSAGYYLQGKRVLYASSTTNSTLVGQFSGASTNNGATFNTALGYWSLFTSTSSDYNTAIGYSALKLDTSGSNNTALGVQSLQQNTKGGNNTASGYASMSGNVSGSNNVAFGYLSLFNNRSATNSTAVGYQSAEGTGNYSNQGGVYLGYQSGYSANTGSDYNTLLGYQSGYDVTTGANNIIIGAATSTGSGLTTGSKNILIGINPRYGLLQTGSGQLNIGNLLFGTSLGVNGNLSSGNIGIATSTPSQTLTVAGSARITGALYGSNNSAGSNGYVLQSSATGFRWVATSTLGLGASGATVSSVGLSAPTGFTVSGSPVTSAGTLALSYSAGYQGLLTASSTAWQSFYTTPSSRITAGTGLSWSGNTLNCATASGATQGCLSTADWTSFNGRISSTSLNTSAKLAALITDETGSGALVFGTAPTLSSTTISGILKLSSQTASRGLFIDAKNRATTTALSAYLANSLSDETGSGSVVFSASPTFTGTTTNAGATFSGKVGIGTTTPSAKITVSGGNILQVASGNPTLKGTYDTSGSVEGVYVSGKYAYAADGSSGLELIDISNPASPTLTGTYNTSGSASDVYVSGKYAYVADDSSGLEIIDISNPASPTLTGAYDTPGSANGVYVSGKYAYVADYGSGLQVIDISNPASPSLTGTYNTSTLELNVYVSGKYAYIADDSSGLQVIDISNPASPRLAGSYDTSGNANDVYVSGKYAYVADAVSGLQVIDISNPASPSLTGTYNTSGTAEGVYVSGKYAYVGDSGSGLQVINISNPASPTLIGTYDTSGSAFGVYVSGKYAYVGDVGSGLEIIDINGAEFPALYAGNIETNDLNATENIIAGNDIYAQGGITAGLGGIYSRGGIFSYVASSTIANAVAASFMGGRVGIGTTSPSSKLDVWGNLRIGTSSTPTLFANTGNGRVGIGTSTPSQTLTVAGSIRATGALYGSNNSAGSNGYVLKSTGTGFLWVATSTLGFGSTFTNSAQLAALLSDETGSGAAVFGTAPTLSSTTISGILKLSSQTASRALFTDAQSRATTTALSSYLANSLSDETGSGSVVFSANPTFTGKVTLANATTTNFAITGKLYDSGSSAGSNGYVLKSTGTGFVWVATSTLGIGGVVTASNGLTKTVNDIALGGTLTGNTTIAAGNANSLTLTSDLTSAARSTYPLVISQANNATNNNSVGLLQLSNLDTASAGALLNITQADTAGTGISFTSLTGGTSITVANTSGIALNANTLTTGTGLTATALTTGSAVVAGIPNGATTASALSVTSAAAAITADYTGSIINIAPTRTLTAAATRNDSGNFLKLSRSNTSNGASSVFNNTGDLAAFSSNCTQTLGTCSDSSSILSLTQSYAAASAAVFKITGAGTGNLAILDTSNASANGVSVDVQSNSSSQYALSVTSNNGATNALRVLANGNVGIGTSTPAKTLSVAGDVRITGALYGSNNSAGSNGYVLKSTGTGFQWVATSTLGITGVTNFLGLSDTPSSYNTGRVLYESGSAVTDSSTFTFANSKLTAPIFNASAASTTLMTLNNVPFLRASSTNESLALGQFAGLAFNASNLYNIAIGDYALSTANTSYNTAVGFAAGYQSASSSSSDFLTAVGYNSGRENAGDNVTALGFQSGYQNHGIDGTFVGYGAGQANTGTYTTITGYGAGQGNTGNYLTAYGVQSGYQNTGGAVVALGYLSAAQNTANALIAIGNEASRYRSASSSIMIGYRAGYGSDLTRRSIANSTFVGDHAGFGITTGNNNLLLGYFVGDALSSGSNNIAIGYNIDLPSNTGSNQLDIGNLIYGTGIDGTNTTLSSGKIGIGTTTPSAKLSVDNTAMPTGSELVTNGTFTGNAIGWSLGDCVAYSSNHISTTYSSCSSPLATTTVTVTAGNTYLLTFTLSGVANDTVSWWLGNLNTNDKGPFGNGTHTVAFTPTSSGTVSLGFESWDYRFGGTWTLDNVSIKQTNTISPSMLVKGYNGNTVFSIGDNFIQNVSLGEHSLSATSTAGGSNTAVGYGSLSLNTTGYYNQAFGVESLYSNTTGYRNSALGDFAMFNNTTGYRNSAFGNFALYANATGTGNSAFGDDALYYNRASSNTAFGEYALSNDTWGGGNTAVGSNALLSNVDGYGNVALGDGALSNNLSGVYNTSVGSGAGGGNSGNSAGGNTFIGASAGNRITGGGDNTAIGTWAGYDLIDGSYNVIIGNNFTPDTSITSGDENIIIGHDAHYGLSATSSGQLNIGNLLFGTGLGSGNTLSTGNIGIGTTTPSQALTIAGNLRLTGALYDSLNSAGTNGMVLQSTGSGQKWVATSTLGIAGGSSLFTDGGATTYLTSLTDSLGIGTTTSVRGAHTTKLAIQADFTGATTFFSGLHVSGTQSSAGALGYYGITADPIYAAAGNSSILIGVNGGPIIKNGKVASFAGIQGSPTVSAGASSTNTMGIYASPINTGTTTNLYGVYSAPLQNGGGTTLTNEYGFYTKATFMSSTVQYVYGLYIDSPTNAGSTLTNYYGVYQADGSAKNYLAGKLGIGTTSPSAKLQITGTAGQGDIFAISSSTNARLLTFSAAGKLGIGSTTPQSLLTLDKQSLTGAVIAGMKQNFSFTNSTASAVYYGDNTYITNAPTATSTLVGKMIKIKDSTTYGNVVRGLEVQAHLGTNTKGENTALSGYGRTFGVRGTTEGDAGGVYQPAGIFAETRGTTQGNAIRAYSSSITTEDLVSLFQDTSTFAGTGLVMNFGNSGGSFSSTTSKFLDLQNAGVSNFVVKAHGETTIGDGTTAHKAGLQIGYGGLCVDNDGTCNASTTGKITSVSSAVGNSDLAEMYFSSEDLVPGDIVSTAGALSVTKADDTTQGSIIGVVSTKPGLTLGFDDTSLTSGQTGYPVALSGRVPIRLSTENGPIKKGDKIALSSIPGVGMKATKTGTVVGVALEDYNGAHAYSDGFINQFGSDIAKQKVKPTAVSDDPHLNDGCYHGGGGALGEAPCAPKATSTATANSVAASTTDAQNNAVLHALSLEHAETMTTSNGKDVEVGEALMFVNLGWQQSIEESAALADFTSTSTDIVLGGDGHETLLSRLKTLAQGFVNGVLSVLELHANKVVVKDEMCVDDVCVTADDLRALLQNANRPQDGSGTGATTVSTDQSSSAENTSTTSATSSEESSSSDASTTVVTISQSSTTTKSTVTDTTPLPSDLGPDETPPPQTPPDVSLTTDTPPPSTNQTQDIPAINTTTP